MKKFLQLVSEDLYKRFGNDLSHTIVLFPNKRASLFLNNYLAQCSNAPIWMPRYLSISDFFLSLSDKTIADPIETVCRLYRQYVLFTKSSETLDYFYGWGERLLADFDDIDKNMADAKQLFRDMKDYASLEEFNYLDNDQIEQLKKFCSDFSEDKQTAIKRRFHNLWKVMYDLYKGLREDLATSNKAYEGQLYREVVEKLLSHQYRIPDNIGNIAIVGFNVLNRVEKVLFKYLADEGKAIFYWDYDSSYVNSDESSKNEAGLFIKENLKSFPNALSQNVFDNFMNHREERVLEFAEAQTDLAQAQSLKNWIENPLNYNQEDGKQTAIILCDENLLQPVLHSLPQSIRDTNITMGFPLSNTPAYTCVIDYITEIEKDFDYRISQEKNRNKIVWAKGKECLSYLKEFQVKVKEEYAKALKISENDTLLYNLYVEAYFQCYTSVNHFVNLVQDGLLQVQLPTIFKLLRQVLHSLTIPFHGEPLTGLQIMGVLETRCLDFDNVLMLSVNEGILPHKETEASFIPLLLRKMYGLTTPVHQTSVFAYYFYRILQRAKRVRLCYNISTEGTRCGEMSRFMRALLSENSVALNIKHLSLSPALRPILSLKPTVEKDGGDFLEEVKNKGMSPSALKAYFTCHLKFYYKYVKHLKKPQEQDAIINNNDFGTVFHKAVELIYNKELATNDQKITTEIIKRYINSTGEQHLKKIIDDAFYEVNEEREERGETLTIPKTSIACHALTKYLHFLLKYESGQFIHSAPAKEFSHIVTEQKKSITLPINIQHTDVDIKLYGFIDRRDEAVLDNGQHVLRIIDYKTGKRSDKDKIKNIDEFFSDKKNYPENALQTLIYSLMFTKEEMPIVPMLYYIPSLPSKDFSPFITINGETITDFHSIAKDFKDMLINNISEMLSPNNNFEPTKIEDHCKYCDYKLLCDKKG